MFKDFFFHFLKPFTELVLFLFVHSQIESFLWMLILLQSVIVMQVREKMSCHWTCGLMALSTAFQFFKNKIANPRSLTDTYLKHHQMIYDEACIDKPKNCMHHDAMWYKLYLFLWFLWHLFKIFEYFLAMTCVELSFYNFGKSTFSKKHHLGMTSLMALPFVPPPLFLFWMTTQ